MSPTYIQEMSVPAAFVASSAITTYDSGHLDSGEKRGAPGRTYAVVACGRFCDSPVHGRVYVCTDEQSLADVGFEAHAWDA